MKKVILAFSGGLDTSFCLLYLKKKGYQVISLTVDTGGFSKKEKQQIKHKAFQLGVKKHILIDGKENLYQKVISYIIKGNILRGGVYPICVAAERIIQAIELVKIARKEKAEAVAHGSTGAGNDQVRFDVAISALAPELEIITPIRELGISRQREIAYLKKHGFKVDQNLKKYSINKGLLGTTVGGSQTIRSWETVPDKAYPLVVPINRTPDKAKKIIISFKKGLPFKVDNQELKGIAIMKKLNSIGAKHGIGKGIHLGDTILGIKGRIAFEAPAALILIKAHQELEKLVLSKEQLFWKNILSQVYGDLIHQGQYFNPVREDLERFIDSSQEKVTGEVKLKLYRGNVFIQGVKSTYSLMDNKIAIYGEENYRWTGEEAKGFSKIFGLQSIIANRAS